MLKNKNNLGDVGHYGKFGRPMAMFQGEVAKGRVLFGN